jgi:hypothetical protein
VSGRLGKCYLYFADHKGRYIRLAYADNVLGPWKVHVPGSLQLEGSYLLTEPLFNPNMRHSAILKRGDTLFVFWTQVGEAPETILLSTIDVAADWTKWSNGPAVEVQPTRPRGGAVAGSARWYSVARHGSARRRGTDKGRGGALWVFLRQRSHRGLRDA